MRGKKVKDINKIARELAETNPLGYKKIRDILKKAAPLSRQRFYQIKHKIMGLCARCDRPLAVGNAEHCAYHLVAVKKAVQARTKRKNIRENEALIKFAQEREKTFKREEGEV